MKQENVVLDYMTTSGRITKEELEHIFPSYNIKRILRKLVKEGKIIKHSFNKEWKIHLFNVCYKGGC